MELSVLYEDNHLIAVDKPAGVLAQGDRWREPSLLDLAKEYIRARYGKSGKVFLGLVHRLDRPVSGVMLFARTSKAAARLHRQFAERRVTKLYAALVRGDLTPRPGSWIRCERLLARSGDRTVAATTSTAGSFPAVLDYMVIAAGGGRSLLLVRLITGKKHQIRAQLSLLGMPIAGDLKYGGGDPLPDGSICLHAAYLGIDHPVGSRRLHLISPLPLRIVSLLEDADRAQPLFSEQIGSFTGADFR